MLIFCFDIYLVKFDYTMSDLMKGVNSYSDVNCSAWMTQSSSVNSMVLQNNFFHSAIIELVSRSSFHKR